jgi:serine phosphatase RsbU (regulator of sigma subunit)
MAFVTSLFHLPTAEVYERKQSELSSLHNLSRLVTQVFDFKDLVNTVTHMTREVCGAQSAWLEMIREGKVKGTQDFEVVGMNNISESQIALISANEEFSLRKLVIESKKVLLVDEVSTDRRTRHMKQHGIRIGSLLSVPLVSHDQIIGILHATKDVEYGFDQDDIDVVTTFADHVTIAIENSRLIAQSLERERYRQEMMVARDMQRRLLPQKFPTSRSFEIAAMSEPAMEVGGDYFDFVELSDGRVGVVVGDVSGKGVSAAFYMAEVKGIFQSLSKLCDSPRELLIRANHTLIGNLEKKAFISLLYAILDVNRATIDLARAGHCPMIYVSENEQDMIRPSGLGLGLTDGEIFSISTEEKKLRLKKGDVCLFYTDGITESRNEGGEEFGYERLVALAAEIRNQSAREIQDRILSEIRAYCGKTAFSDDLTLVVIKWLGV